MRCLSARKALETAFHHYHLPATLAITLWSETDFQKPVFTMEARRTNERRFRFRVSGFGQARAGHTARGWLCRNL